MRHDLKVSKGSAVPVVAQPGVGRLPFKGENEQEAGGSLFVGDKGHAGAGDWGGLR